MAAAHPDIARKGVLLRKYGQEVIRVTAGKRVHGTGSVPGGVNKHVSARPTAMLLQRDIDADARLVRSDAVDSPRRCIAQQPGAVRPLRQLPLEHAVAGAADGAMDLYDGVLRARDADGATAVRRCERRRTTST